MQKITIYNIFPGMNEIIKEKSKKNHYFYSKMKRDYTNIAKMYILEQKKYNYDCMIDIFFRWYEPNKKRDKDNIIAGEKFIIDGLVASKIIKNDGWSNIGILSHRIELDKSNPRVELFLKKSE